MQTFALHIALFGIPALIQQNGSTAGEPSWQAYGYISLGAIVLAIIIVVLIRRQHRKFNE